MAGPRQTKRLLRLDLDKCTSLEFQPAAWIPNPSTSKLASAFTNDSSRTSIYCSQCTRFFDNPHTYYGHISTCE
ncbi:hypothetical protein IWW41_002551 [Coemansia sp. RSA 2522]|nr:hypothetical protein IWW41_002551 [Coemansia sp. RSA 2522]KAJ2446789.1 hypothetical protein IWW46_000702 [Coemansia sp. RSA 2440]KAJ2724982.1 hypothetical protein H4S00_002154 [Coemansia sp. D1744]KAJ2837356.1 hypothetical protein J3B01_002195 [Coemansia erecta]